MRLVKRTQRDLIAAFWSSSAAEEARRFDGEGDGEEWLDLEKYMEETAALLDLCNALKSAAARLRRRCMAADFAAAAGGEDEGGGRDAGLRCRSGVRRSDPGPERDAGDPQRQGSRIIPLPVD